MKGSSKNLIEIKTDRKLLFLIFLIFQCAFSFAQESVWLQEINTSKPDTATVKSYLKLFKHYLNTQPQKSAEMANRGILIAKQIKDEYGEAQLICARGTLYFRTVNIDSAKSDFLSVLPVFIRLKKQFDEANIYRQLGMVADYESNTLESAKMYMKAIGICEAIGHDKLMASCLGNMGILHERQGHQKEAMKYYNRCEKLFIKNNDTASLASSYINIGNIYDNLVSYDSSLFYYAKAEILCKKINHLPLLAMVYYNTGNIHHLKKDFNSALEYFKSALKLNEELNEVDNLIGNYMQIGNILMDTKKYKEALPYLEKSLQMAEQVKYKAMIMKNYEVLASYYGDLGDFRKAFELQKKYITARDSFMSEENQNNLADLEKKYDTEKKQHQIDNLGKENKIKNAEVQKHLVEIKAKKNQQYALFGGLGLVIIFAGFMYNRFKVTQKQKSIIEQQKTIVETQKHLVEEKQKEVMDSIRYAQRIQRAQLPSEKKIENTFKRILKN